MIKVKENVPGTETRGFVGPRRVGLCGAVDIFGHSEITLAFRDCSLHSRVPIPFPNKAAFPRGTNDATARLSCEVQREVEPSTLEPESCLLLSTLIILQCLVEA